MFPLNRTKPRIETMLQRYQSIFQELSLDLAGLDSDKVVHLEGPPGQDYFGLPAHTWNEVSTALLTHTRKAIPF